MNKCLYCSLPLNVNETNDYHEKCARIFFEQSSVPRLDYSFDSIKNLAKETIHKSIALTGVQAKLSLHLAKQQKDSRFTIVGLWGNYILKPPSISYPYICEVEQCTMQLAQAFQIPVVPHSLIKLQTGELCYITRRIDRNNKTNTPIHMEDFCQLSGKLTEQKYQGSMEQAAKIIRKYSSNAGFDILRFFELSVFSFITGNADMHLKNFSLIHNENAFISFSPAYDLLCTRLFISEKEDSEEMALSLNGKKRKLTINDFLLFAKNIGLSEKQVDSVFARFQASIPEAKKIIQNSFMPENLQEEFFEIIKKRASEFFPKALL